MTADQRSGHGWIVLALVAGAGIGLLLGLVFDHWVIGMIVGFVIAGLIGLAAIEEDARIRSRHVQEGVASDSPRGDASPRDNGTTRFGSDAYIGDGRHPKSDGDSERGKGPHADRIEPSRRTPTDEPHDRA